MKWFYVKPGMPNATELLFLALLVLTGHHNVDELKKWASDVLVGARNYNTTGVEGLPVEWKPSRFVNVPVIFAPIHDAYCKKTWRTDVLDNIGKVIQAWQGDGRCDKLDAQRLREHSEKLRGPSKDKKSKAGGPARWKTSESLIGVATLISKHATDLKQRLAATVFTPW